MYFLITNSQISGFCDTLIEPPEGFEIIEAPDGHLPQGCYYDGEIKIKPPQPSPDHYWDLETRAWKEFVQAPLVSAPITNRWADFLLGVIQTTTYEKIKNFLGAKDPAEYTVLVALLNNSALPDTDRARLLENALRRVKSAMKISPTPLTSKDVATINELLSTKLLVDWNLNG